MDRYAAVRCHQPMHVRPAAQIETQVFYNGELLVGRRWPSRAPALAEADEKLKELQRVGWATHW